MSRIRRADFKLQSLEDTKEKRGTIEGERLQGGYVVKRLIICNTYFQLILAIQMRLTLFQSDMVDIEISDHSVGAEKIADKLRSERIFHAVIFKKTKAFTYGQSRLKNVKDIITYNFMTPRMSGFVKYDEIVFHNLELELYAIADYYRMNHHQVRWARYEEGILSYNVDFGVGIRVKNSRKIRKVLHKIDVAEEVERYYCVFPELKMTHREWEFIAIPQIKKDDEKIKRILNSVFEYRPRKFNKKYIFFSSSSDIDGRDVGEIELVMQIADRVGKENLLIKMHPRDGRAVYDDAGLTVSRNSAVPWELIQLTHDFSGHIFISLISGSMITASAMLRDEIESYYLFPMIRGKNNFYDEYIAKSLLPTIEKLQSAGLCMKLKCINGVDEIMKA